MEEKKAEFKFGWGGIIVPIIPDDTFVVSSYVTSFDSDRNIKSEPISLAGDTINNITETE